MQTTQRKLSSTGGSSQEPGTARIRRSRSVKACGSCRGRKVRCDVLKCGQPCTNCRLDDVECLVAEIDRRRRRTTLTASAPGERRGLPAAEKIILSPNGLGVDEQFRDVEMAQTVYKDSDTISGANHDNQAEARFQIARLPIVPEDAPDDLNVSQDDLVDVENVFEPQLIYEPIEVDQPREESRSSPKDSGVPSQIRNISHSSGSTESCANTQARQRWHNHTFPDYIKPLSRRIPDDDVAYLSSKGALSIPPDEFRNALLLSYIEFVHPYLPLVDLRDLLAIMDEGVGENGKISILLFQSIMFAGAAFVDTAQLNQGGFSTRKAARRMFFRRARLLYDLDCERDQISLIQTFLLLSFWFERPDDEKNTWHWLALAISLCQVVGLHRNSNGSRSLKETRLWKRIWWSCFMRDRLVALATRRPTRIKLEDCDVPMLAMDDFELVNLPGIISSTRASAFLGDINMQRQLAILCIEKVKLCVIIGTVLSDHGSLMNGTHGHISPTSKERTRMVLLAPNIDPEIRDMKKYGDELRRWATELPDEVIYQRPASEDFQSSLVLHKALLQMLYYSTTLCTLHLSLAPVSASFQMSIDGRGSEARELLREKARLAAVEIIRISQDLHELDLVRYLPTSGVTVVLLGTIVLLGVRSENKEIRENCVRGFTQGFHIMRELRDNYFSADYATTLLERAIRKKGPRVAVQSLDVASSTRDINGTQPVNQPIFTPNADFPVESRGSQYPGTINYDFDDPTNIMLLSADSDPSLSNLSPGDFLNPGDPMYNFGFFDYTPLPLDMSNLAYIEGLGPIFSINGASDYVGSSS